MRDKALFPAPDGNNARRIPKSLQIFYLAKAGGHNINAYYYDRETIVKLQLVSRLDASNRMLNQSAEGLHRTGSLALNECGNT
jgi:hypothetical protein